MKKIQLFTQDVRRAIEGNFQNNILYQAIEGAANRFLSHSTGFHLLPAELFYHTIFTLDYLRPLSEKEALAYCKNNLWADLLGYFDDRLPEKVEQNDVRMAIGTVLEAVAFFLIRVNQLSQTHIATEILGIIEREIPGNSNLLNSEFINGTKCLNEQNLTTHIFEYYTGTSVLSEEMDCIIDAVRADERERSKPAPRNYYLGEGSTLNDIHDNTNSNIYITHGRR